MNLEKPQWKTEKEPMSGCIILIFQIFLNKLPGVKEEEIPSYSEFTADYEDYFF